MSDEITARLPASEPKREVECWAVVEREQLFRVYAGGKSFADDEAKRLNRIQREYGPYRVVRMVGVLPTRKGPR